MSQARPLPRVEPASAWHMYRSMVGIGVICGLLIVTVFLWTAPTIERNRAEALQRAIFQVLPEARSSETFSLIDDERVESLTDPKDPAPRVHAGYDEQQRLVGIAVEAQGQGYQDVIRVLYGYSFNREAIIGIRVLESKETPGLGDKIETDPDFLINFQALDVTLAGDPPALQHPIEFAKHGTKTEAWQVDGITGATISSRAITTILDDSTRYWIPRIRQRVRDFQKAG